MKTSVDQKIQDLRKGELFISEFDSEELNALTQIAINEFTVKYPKASFIHFNKKINKEVTANRKDLNYNFSADILIQESNDDIELIIEKSNDLFKELLDYLEANNIDFYFLDWS